MLGCGEGRGVGLFVVGNGLGAAVLREAVGKGVTSSSGGVSSNCSRRLSSTASVPGIPQIQSKPNKIYLVIAMLFQERWHCVL